MSTIDALEDLALPTPDCLIELPAQGQVRVYIRQVSGPDFDDEMGWIAGLVVEEEFQGTGLGSTLVSCAEEFIRWEEVRYAGLHCPEELVGFYEGHGFSRAPNVPGPGVTMVRDLVRHEPFLHVIDHREPW